MNRKTLFGQKKEKRIAIIKIKIIVSLSHSLAINNSMFLVQRKQNFAFISLFAFFVRKEEFSIQEITALQLNTADERL